MEIKQFNRRAFIEKSAVLALGTLATGILSRCKDSGTDSKEEDTPPEEYQIDLTLEANAALNDVSGALKFDVEGYSKPIIVIRSTETEVIALSSVCTHNACEVELPNANNEIVCNCHGSKFDLEGNVLQSPPGITSQSPLEEIPATLDGNRIILDV